MDEEKLKRALMYLIQSSIGHAHGKTYKKILTGIKDVGKAIGWSELESKNLALKIWSEM